MGMLTNPKLIIEREHEVVSQQYQAELDRVPAGPAAQMAHTLALLQLAYLKQMLLSHKIGQQCRLDSRKINEVGDQHALEQRKTFNKGIVGHFFTTVIPGGLSAVSIPLGLYNHAGANVASQAASTLSGVLNPLFENQYSRLEHQHELERSQQLGQTVRGDQNSYEERRRSALEALARQEEQRHRTTTEA